MQAFRTNKAASDATIEARVVMPFVYVKWRGAALSPTGHVFGTSQVASIK